MSAVHPVRLAAAPSARKNAADGCCRKGWDPTCSAPAPTPPGVPCPRAELLPAPAHPPRLRGSAAPPPQPPPHGWLREYSNAGTVSNRTAAGEKLQNILKVIGSRHPPDGFSRSSAHAPRRSHSRTTVRPGRRRVHEDPSREVRELWRAYRGAGAVRQRRGGARARPVFGDRELCAGPGGG